MQANGNNEALQKMTATPWEFTESFEGTLADWLVSDRLMTPDIRRSFLGDVSIRVLREGPIDLPADVTDIVTDCPADGWLREITMHADDDLLVHALCFAPTRTCERHPWLLELGDQPLGGQLASLEDVTRVSKSYCRGDRVGAEVASLAGPGAWSRRSLFDLQGEALVLIEHLSALLTAHVREGDDEPQAG